VRVLARPKYFEDAKQFIKTCEGPGTAQVIIGDVVQMDLGMSGPDVRQMLRELEYIYHLAAISPRSERMDNARQVNVEGTRSILDMAMSAERLQRFCFFSTAFVSGTRRGVVLESELDRGQRFRTVFEQTKFEAEKLVRRAASDLNVTIFRPSLVVGHSQTGEFDQSDDPYHMMLSFLNAPLNIHMPLPGHGDFPLNMVPVDYVCEAAYQISRDPRSAGRTFHLTDPNPLPARRVLDLIADHGKRKRPRGTIHPGIARRILKLPGIRKMGTPARVVNYFDQLVIYNTTNTLELLAGSTLQCPSFDSYVGNLVTHLQQVARI